MTLSEMPGLAARRPSAVAGFRPGGYNLVMAFQPRLLPDEGALRMTVSSPLDMAVLADVLAPFATRGDVLALRGPLGAGKTLFARAFIAARARAAGLDADAVGEVPSPTFTLVQTYDLPDTPIWHFDLFRLERPEDAFELGIDDAFALAISLIEWPEKLGGYLPAARLDLEIGFTGAPTARELRLTGGDAWPPRLARLAKTLAPS
jgi:tRNA threonylcarbamoyladenosine biosynthesis protein TsaE